MTTPVKLLGHRAHELEFVSLIAISPPLRYLHDIKRRFTYKKFRKMLSINIIKQHASIETHFAISVDLSRTPTLTLLETPSSCAYMYIQIRQHRMTHSI